MMHCNGGWQSRSVFQKLSLPKWFPAKSDMMRWPPVMLISVFFRKTDFFLFP